MIFTDKQRLVKITMQDWDGSNLSADYSSYLYNVTGEIEIVSEIDFDSAIDWAHDWENQTGDFGPDGDFYTGQDPEDCVLYISDVIDLPACLKDADDHEIYEIIEAIENSL